MKIINHTRLSIKLQSTSRIKIRSEIFHHWLNEVAGTPTLKNTYRYDVETLPDNSLIYLTRPTRLNKGADFVIYCENFTKFKNTNPRPPKHDDIIREIEFVISQSMAHRQEFIDALKRIWECEDSDLVISNLKVNSKEIRASRALLLAKWFFIEQDVTYWTESGRHMLWNSIKNRLCI